MTKKITLCIACIALFTLSACTMSSDRFQNVHVVLKENASARKLVLAECLKRENKFSASDRANMAAIMNVPESKWRFYFCTRMIKAIANGRISYSDYISTQRGGDMSKVIKILQGR